jgi:hypothetical protein
MSVIPLTIFFSLILAFLFIAFFAHDQYRRRFASSESDSLLPLAPETPRPVEPEKADHHAEHEHDHDGCGCRSGKRAPCPGCLKNGPRSVKPSA